MYYGRQLIRGSFPPWTTRRSFNNDDSASVLNGLYLYYCTEKTTMTLHRKRSSTTTTRPLQQPRKVHFQGRRVGTMVYLHYDSTRVEKGLQLPLQTHSLAREARSITWAYNTPFWMMVLERERSRNSSNPDIMMGTRGPFGKSRNRHPRTTYYSAEFHLSWI